MVYRLDHAATIIGISGFKSAGQGMNVGVDHCRRSDIGRADAGLGRGLEARGRNADSRSMLRQKKSVAIVACLFDLWEKELGKVSGKSKTAEANRFQRAKSLMYFVLENTRKKERPSWTTL